MLTAIAKTTSTLGLAVAAAALCTLATLSPAHAQAGFVTYPPNFPPPVETENETGAKPACSISVPVKISRLHKDVKNVAVICGVWPNESDAKSFSNKSVLGVGQAPVKVNQSRAYNGAVSVAIFERAAPATQIPAGGLNQSTGRPTHWSCGLYFVVKGVGAPTKPSKTAKKKPLKATGTFRPLVWGKLKS